MRDMINTVRFVIADALASFRRNNGPAAASSIAFSALIAVIPALFLLTTLIGMSIGSSREALRAVREALVQLIPAYSEVILREVLSLAEHRRAFGIMNILVLLFTVTPLVAGLRRILGGIFRKRTRRPFLLDKLIDLVLTVLFLLGITAVAAAGVVLHLVQKGGVLTDLPAGLGGGFQFLLLTTTAFLLYRAFSRGANPLHLLAGAAASAALWFVLRPLFGLFLLYNPGFGFAFGSFKSLFVVMLWIYYSLVALLLGAEVAASLPRRRTVVLKRLVEGKGGLPASLLEGKVLRLGEGEEIFREGDPSGALYVVRSGSVGIWKDGEQVSVAGPGQSFGEVSFLLAAPRIGTAVAREETEIAMIDDRNVADLMNEFPAFVVGMLRDMGARLRKADRLID